MKLRTTLLATSLALSACAETNSASANPERATQAQASEATAQKPAATAAAEKPAEATKPTPEEARAFVKDLNDQLFKLTVQASSADWIKSTYITDDTERVDAAMNDQLLGYTARQIKESAKFEGLTLDPDVARQIHLLRVSSPVIAPSDPDARRELTTLAAKLEGAYGKAKYCKNGQCQDLDQLSDIMRTSHDYQKLLDVWTGWHDTAKPSKKDYARFVQLANEGAREVGFKDTADLWRSAYDMPPEQFEKTTDDLWNQVKPLYDDLHCYVRARLQKVYGKDKVPDGAPIPAHLLGNMWAQEWNNIYPLVEPYKTSSNLDVTGALVRQHWDAIKMVKTAEGFFTSMGLDPLPQTFWERSLFVKPENVSSPFRKDAAHAREVVCHASAWDVTYSNDLRIKVCLQPNEDDLVTLHHELGHDYYFHAYYKLPILYQQGANDGFHEAIGDALTLAMTPAYYERIGLLGKARQDEKTLIDVQMKDALSKVAFLPFGKLIDQWRWDVFSGKVKPEQYNEAWWALRRKYQGVAAPTARPEDAFDPGAKYHVPANVPYTRYFLARILQFQFYKAMCDASGFKGPLHECSFYGSKEAGARLEKMLELGASKPWPDALEAMTGSRKMSAEPLLEYFHPLQTWLEKQNQGQKCGW